MGIQVWKLHCCSYDRFISCPMLQLLLVLFLLSCAIFWILQFLCTLYFDTFYTSFFDSVLIRSDCSVCEVFIFCPILDYYVWAVIFVFVCLNRHMSDDCSLVILFYDACLWLIPPISVLMLQCWYCVQWLYFVVSIYIFRLGKDWEAQDYVVNQLSHCTCCTFCIWRCDCFYYFIFLIV